MQISVKGKQLDVGDALRRHVVDSMEAIAGKYFSRPIEGTVVIAREAHLFRADISAHVGRGILLQAHGEAGEAYAAFDQGLERIAKRLRRHKRRLRNHHRGAEAAIGASGAQAMRARQYVLQPLPELAGEEAAGEEAAKGEDEHGAPEADPLVIAEMETHVQSLTVGEAAMQMDLAELPALLFRNRAHGELNMIYRRADGNIGWVDPRGEEFGNDAIEDDGSNGRATPGDTARTATDARSRS